MRRWWVVGWIVVGCLSCRDWDKCLPVEPEEKPDSTVVGDTVYVREDCSAYEEALQWALSEAAYYKSLYHQERRLHMRLVKEIRPLRPAEDESEWLPMERGESAGGFRSPCRCEYIHYIRYRNEQLLIETKRGNDLWASYHGGQLGPDWEILAQPGGDIFLAGDRGEAWFDGLALGADYNCYDEFRLVADARFTLSGHYEFSMQGVLNQPRELRARLVYRLF